MKVSASNRKIIKRVCVCAVLLALVLLLVRLPLPFHMSLSGVRVEGAAAAEPAALEAEGWRLCRILRTTELRASFAVETGQGAKTYDGKSLASFVYNRDHVVKEISGDRAVITYGGVVVAAVKLSDLTLA